MLFRIQRHNRNGSSKYLPGGYPSETDAVEAAHKLLRNCDASAVESFDIYDTEGKYPRHVATFPMADPSPAAPARDRAAETRSLDAAEDRDDAASATSRWNTDGGAAPTPRTRSRRGRGGG